MRASGANNVVGTSEPLSLDGQQIYRALSDADATAASAFLSGGLSRSPPASATRPTSPRRPAVWRAPPPRRATSPPRGTWRSYRAGLPVYTGEVETARADNRLGLPLGAAYLREASALMRGTLLPCRP